MGSLQGQNVVVVGGSRGVGRCIAKAAFAEGAAVLAVARGAADLQELSWEASGLKTLAADATQESAPDHVFAALAPDILVLCAGALAPSAPLQDQAWDRFSVNWETDVKASFLFCRAALQGRLKPGGRVLLLSSGAAFTGGPPNSGGYSGAKQMQMFLAAHAQKEADRLGLGLRFMALAPMRIMAGTGVGDHGIAGIAAYLGISPADFLASLDDVQTPCDVAEAVVALAAGRHQGTAFTVSASGLAATQ
ncbi:SDR family NAD(P)-dependent oxidoreductase [Mesorhizobium sp. ES1-1]|uniref:SDR family NAD(P)-dependent oxidoreductase n=1 Tax=Mesorhizobium sp. ES1-1 TaxID=2876629 RepID=UPI001CD004C3|nr:SDR family NAD(P)-dependent oxidoreductase [Mesorhizobium sp. ES1-1]MBZ9676391.1 SDR family oxidoreductase [Mesorhizobium sp. ES1-1]